MNTATKAAPYLHPVPSEPESGTGMTSSESTELALPPGDLDKLSKGQPWDERTIISEVLQQTEHLVYAGLEIGRLLLWSREIIGHGQFLPWLKVNFPFSQRTAYNYMQVACFALRHPSMAEPAARMGLRKTLELARLPEGLTEELVNGQLPELAPAELETLTYPEMKKRLKKLEDERSELAQKVDERDKKIKRLQEEEEEESASMGRMAKGAQRKILEKMEKLRSEFDGLMAEIGIVLDTAATRCAEGELDISVRLRIKGFTQYMLAYTEAEESRYRALANDDVSGAEIVDPWERQRTMDENYVLPAGRKLPFTDET